MIRALCLVLVAAAVHAATVDVDGASVYYEVSGKGEPAIVLIHGWTLDSSSWRLQRPALEKEFRVLAIDLPGHGKSDKPNVKYDAALFARAVASAMEDAKIKRAVLVGHSMGIMVARQVLEDDPSRVPALVSVDGAVFPPEMGTTMLKPLAAKMAGAEGAAFRSKFAASMFGEATPPPLREELQKNMLATPEHVAISAFENTVAGDTWSLKPTAVPVLLFMQKRPNAEAREYPKKVLTNIVDFQEWTGVSHFLHLERVDDFNNLVIQFARKYK